MLKASPSLLAGLAGLALRPGARSRVEGAKSMPMSMWWRRRFKTAPPTLVHGDPTLAVA